jgi:hypothetical protein
MVARAVVRQHPQHIGTPEELHTYLKTLAEALEPPPMPAPALLTYQQEEPLVRQFSPAGAARMATSLPVREGEHSGRGLSAYSGKLPSLEEPPASPTVTNPLFNAGQQQMLSQTPSSPKTSSPALMILLLGLLAFALFFVVGYFLGHALIH